MFYFSADYLKPEDDPLLIAASSPYTHIFPRTGEDYVIFDSVRGWTFVDVIKTANSQPGSEPSFHLIVNSSPICLFT